MQTQERWHDPSKLRARSQRYNGDLGGAGEIAESGGWAAALHKPRRGLAQRRRCGRGTGPFVCQGKLKTAGHYTSYGARGWGCGRESW